MINNNTKAVNVPGNPWEGGVEKISGTITRMHLMDMQSLTIKHVGVLAYILIMVLDVKQTNKQSVIPKLKILLVLVGDYDLSLTYPLSFFSNFTCPNQNSPAPWPCLRLLSPAAILCPSSPIKFAVCTGNGDVLCAHKGRVRV